jgi:DEAD/DEAH box helicase domain-containing protein
MENRLLQEKKKRKETKNDTYAETLIDQSIDLQYLQTLHFKLVSYYTFLSSRKHIITSFDLFKEHIFKTLDKELKYQDVAKIKAIIPHNMIFEYVDKNQFVLEEKHFTWKDGFKQKEADIFDIDKNNPDSINNQILIIEFVDSGVKSRYRNDFQKLTADSIKKLIIKRDNKFKKELNNFVKIHKNESLSYLNKVYIKYLPEQLKFVNPMDEMNQISLNSDHKPIPELIDTFKKCSFYKNQISNTSTYKINPKYAKYDTNFFHDVDLHPDLQSLLISRGIEQVYLHQSIGLKGVLLENKHVISTTSTSSGKSLIYQLPILQSLLSNAKETTLLLFPTKALSQDQHRALLSLVSNLPSINSSKLIRTYDGDTSKADRQEIKADANVILTNPDMLHLTLLPNHKSWSRVLSNLKYVVIDELHIYKGTFGSNVAYILRRLRRVCSLFGNNNVQFISSSATLNDASLHLSKMIGLPNTNDVLWIDESVNGSPCGTRNIVGWNPDLDHGGSMISDTSKIIVQLLKLNIRTIVFCTIRKTVELVMKEVRSQLKDESVLLSHIMSYRGGYSIADRRKIEHQMFNGGLTCIVATNALEVGIDIGGLDVVLMCGFPISLSGFEQEMGRAGRRGLDSLCLLVAGGDPVSQYYVNKIPELVERKEWEDLCIDLKNLMIVEGQLQCAFKEKNVSNDDLPDEWTKWWNCLPWEIYENLIREKFKWDNDIGKWTCNDSYLPYPPLMVSIRAIDEDSFAVVDITGGNGRQEVIETIEQNRTTFTLYEGGIFIHQGLPYLVKDFNVDEKFALVERVNVDWTTNQRDFTDIDPVLIERIRSLKGLEIPIYFGNIVKTSIVFGFFKVDKRGTILDSVEVNNPPVKYKSKGVWIDLSKELINLVTSHKLNMAGAIHAVQHAIMNVLPRFVTIGNYDEVGCECKAPEKEFAHRETKRKRPARLILYDNKGGKTGNGLSARVFECAELVLQESSKIVDECTCSFGCPLCCAGMQCTENSLVLSKDGCKVILRYLLNDSDPLKDIPYGPEANMPEITIETIVPVGNGAPTVKISNNVELNGVN